MYPGECRGGGQDSETPPMERQAGVWGAAEGREAETPSHPHYSSGSAPMDLSQLHSPAPPGSAASSLCPQGTSSRGAVTGGCGAPHYGEQ